MESARAFGVAFVHTQPAYHAVLEQDSGQKHHRLPVPAVFLVDANGMIEFTYVNPDYRVRLPADLILAAASWRKAGANQR